MSNNTNFNVEDINLNIQTTVPVNETIQSINIQLNTVSIVIIAIVVYLLLFTIVLFVYESLLKRKLFKTCSIFGTEDDEMFQCCGPLSELLNCFPITNFSRILDTCCPKRKDWSLMDILGCQCCGSQDTKSAFNTNCQWNPMVCDTCNVCCIEIRTNDIVDSIK
ncbi:hypothetical protein A3Q56_06398 [Intoshia linei]|uniref:Transmembrane protein n=1 Tax=Intoshia linei TaxID=1819745 RepID=A0A177AVM0_9BILA|nr:hypothetical protein A3Q56_06398 [Intoshia linei]